ncbi:DUF5362 family protein [Alkalilimnicola ehrlichii]|uniref:Transmembrane protein n=1 Tax=Alkalilimnicola ehrlichii TaxID=351052 RepID=A0A3E0WZK5_9GAMM|nr:DUF5362 family protein [Alkalilimnicola ehrlichii]RFA37456.1 hypothetical protein CAL65_09220 [Alkalilimnicola ehrlichii]
MNNTTEQTVARDVIEPIYRAKFWMQLIGVMMILSGVLTAITIVGLLVAWVPIWAGVMLMQAAGAVDRAYNRDDAREAMFAMTRLKTYFTIFGVLLLIYLVFFAFMMLLGIGGGMMAAGF